MVEYSALPTEERPVCTGAEKDQCANCSCILKPLKRMMTIKKRYIIAEESIFVLCSAVSLAIQFTQSKIWSKLSTSVEMFLLFTLIVSIIKAVSYSKFRKWLKNKIKSLGIRDEENLRTWSKVEIKDLWLHTEKLMFRSICESCLTVFAVSLIGFSIFSICWIFSNEGGKWIFISRNMLIVLGPYAIHSLVEAFTAFLQAQMFAREQIDDWKSTVSLFFSLKFWLHLSLTGEMVRRIVKGVYKTIIARPWKTISCKKCKCSCFEKQKEDLFSDDFSNEILLWMAMKNRSLKKASTVSIIQAFLLLLPVGVFASLSASSFGRYKADPIYGDELINNTLLFLVFLGNVFYSIMESLSSFHQAVIFTAIDPTTMTECLILYCRDKCNLLLSLPRYLSW